MRKIPRAYKFGVVVAVFAALGSFAGNAADKTSVDVSAAQRQLLENVESIDVGGGAIPGPVMVLGKKVFGLASCRNYDGTAAFAAAAAFYEKGRAVYLGHPSYFVFDHQLDDTRQLLLNSVKWLAQGKPPKIAVLRNAKIADMFCQLGFDAVSIDSADGFEGFNVLAAGTWREEDVEPVLAFVRAGGGIIGAGLGWGFMYFNPDACFAEAYIENKVFGTIGIFMGDIGVNRWESGDFPALAGEDELLYGTRVDDALRMAISNSFDSIEVKRQAAKTLSCFLGALPSDVRPKLHSILDKLLSRPEAKQLPSPDEALDYNHLLARLAVIVRKNAWLAAPLGKHGVDPAAEVYPGLVRPGAVSTSRVIEVSCSVPRWHSTGLFAPAGKAISVRLARGVETMGLKLRIGTTADNLSFASEWRRAPLVSMEYPLRERSLEVSSPFGGLIYVVVPENNAGIGSAKAKLRIKGAVAAPHFKLGRDNPAEFRRACRISGAPQGEIEGEHFIITAETLALEKVEDPEWIARYWDRVLELNRDLAQWKERRYPERICSDVQLTGGWMHSGYPLMTHIREDHVDWTLDRRALEIGDTWGVFHEIGHSHQNPAWTPYGMGEVTVNLFTCYALENMVQADVREERFPCSTVKSEERLCNWVAGGKDFSELQRDYFLALDMYLRIKEAYGWDSFKKTFARYFEPDFVQLRDDSEKWDIFARTISEVTGRDIAAALAEWSVPLSEETRQYCAKFPPAAASLTRGL